MMKIYLFFVLLLISQVVFAQHGKVLSLKDAVEQAVTNSPKFRLAQTRKQLSYYQYQVYKGDMKPQVTFYGNVPAYSKDYFEVRQPDGSIRFLSRRQNFSNIGFSLIQRIPLTGGVLSLNTDLSRFDDFDNKSHLYNGTPFYIRLDQPLFGFNELKWERKIEPIKLEESKREYVYAIEAIAQQTADFFFSVLEAQSNIQIAQVNLTSTDLIYSIEKQRIDLGTTTEDKLLQLELRTLRSMQDLEKARYDYQIALLNLKVLMGVSGGDSLQLSIPEKIPLLHIDLNSAIGYAKKYRPEFLSFQRKINEARRDVSEANAAKREINLTASFGFNNTGGEVSSIYNNPKDQQRFLIGFNIPIIDWGRRQSRYKSAKALEQLTIYNIELDEQSYLQEITTLVKNIELLTSNVALTLKTDSVAQRRFELSYALYKSGKVSITDLGISQNEKDQARKGYISSLRSFWDSYYLLRKLTLYDFEKNSPLLTTVE